MSTGFGASEGGRRERRHGGPEPHADLALFLRLMKEARPYWGLIVLLALLSLLSTPLSLLLPVPMKIAVDSVLGGEPLPGFLGFLLPAELRDSGEALLFFAVGLVVAIALVSQLRSLGAAVLEAYVGQNLILRFRARLFQHVQRLSLGFHDRRGIADSLYRIQYDATAIEGVAITGVIPLSTAGFTVLAMVYVTVRIDWLLAVVALGITPLLLLLGKLYRGRLRRQWGEAKRLESRVLSVVEEVLGTLRVVKAFGQEEHEEGRFERRAHEGIRARIRANVSEGVFGLLLGLTVAVGTAIVLYVGVRHVQAGSLSLGNLVLVVVYLGMLYQPLQTIGQKVAALQSAFASADRAFRLLEEEPEVVERPDARPLERARGEIEFHDVSFSYDEDDPVLRAVSFRVAPGSLVGIAGETGAGKSTLVGLLPRFHDPTSGRILLDGTDLRDFRLRDLRRQFAIVLQEPVLFSTTIAENIGYGQLRAGDAEIMEAARRANADGFISGLPRGYETPVGERGMMLSGGQRQLVSLARAFLRDAPILILDEPTSAIDVNTESAVMDAFQRLMAGRTTFMISHRLYTLESCDLVLVLEGGRLVEAERSKLRVPGT